MRSVLGKALRWTALATAGLAASLLALGLVASDRLTGLFFFPSPDCAPPPAEAGAVELVRIPAADGTLMEGWYFPARREPGRPPRGLVVHAHGNALNLSLQWRGAKWLAERGFDVLAFDYRGFGNSPGRVTRASAAADVASALDWARRRAAGRGLEVVLFGQSVGAALAVEAAASRADLAAVVLDSPFDSWPGVAAMNLARLAPARALLRAGISAALVRSGPSPAELASLVQTPLFIVSGQADVTCPPAMARHLAERARCDVLEIAGAPHVGQRTAEQGRQAHDAIVAFLERALARAARPARPAA